MNNRNTALSPFNQLLDGFFNSTIGDFIGSDAVFIHPRVNIVENANDFSIQVAAPGLQKSDFNINLEGRNLTISASQESSVEESNEKGKFTRREYNYGSFTRNFTLPLNVERQNIDAEYKDGILSIVIPKKEEAKESNKTIEIK